VAHYKKPGWITTKVFNPTIEFLTGGLGLNVRGAQVLAVRGRKSGQWRTVPVYPLTFEGQQYLVAPRGETEWVRNLRASGKGELRRRSKTTPFLATEVSDEEKPPLLHAYVQRWTAESVREFDISGKDASDEELRRIAPNHPVFRIQAEANQ
jgi:deazaflavin-dependent oxidoreductase (nitroreductase family)